MGLKEVLSKMKIVELEPRPGLRPDPIAPTPPAVATAPQGIAGRPSGPSQGARSTPATPATPATTVQQILDDLPEPEIDERALPAHGEGPSDLPDFDSIYRAAGISDPPHGYTAYKVLEILSSESFAGLDARARAAALAGFLKMNPGGPVPIADVIQDAVRRDQALDKFEELLRGKLAARTQEMERENAALQAEIDELARKNRERMEANRRALTAEQARLGQWQARKRIEERKLFDAAGPFVEENPVSMEPAPAPPGPPEGTSTPGP